MHVNRKFSNISFLGHKRAKMLVQHNPVIITDVSSVHNMTTSSISEKFMTKLITFLAIS
jgi:hypothetical protein